MRIIFKTINRDKSADMCNKVLRNAIKSFAGLNNRELFEIQF